MNYSIKTYPAFDKELKRLAKRYKSLKDDVRRLAVDLLANPTQGVDLGGGMRKVRMSITSKGKGKSGGARVITVLVARSEVEHEIGLHYIYDKSERDNLTDAEMKDIIVRNGL